MGRKHLLLLLGLSFLVSGSYSYLASIYDLREENSPITAPPICASPSPERPPLLPRVTPSSQPSEMAPALLESFDYYLVEPGAPPLPLGGETWHECSPSLRQSVMFSSDHHDQTSQLADCNAWCVSNHTVFFCHECRPQSEGHKLAPRETVCSYSDPPSPGTELVECDVIRINVTDTDVGDWRDIQFSATTVEIISTVPLNFTNCTIFVEDTMSADCSDLLTFSQSTLVASKLILFSWRTVMFSDVDVHANDTQVRGDGIVFTQAVIRATDISLNSEAKIDMSGSQLRARVLEISSSGTSTDGFAVDIMQSELIFLSYGSIYGTYDESNGYGVGLWNTNLLGEPGSSLIIEGQGSTGILSCACQYRGINVSMRTFTTDSNLEWHGNTLIDSTVIITGETSASSSAGFLFTGDLNLTNSHLDMEILLEVPAMIVQEPVVKLVNLEMIADEQSSSSWSVASETLALNLIWCENSRLVQSNLNATFIGSGVNSLTGVFLQDSVLVDCNVEVSLAGNFNEVVGIALASNVDLSGTALAVESPSEIRVSNPLFAIHATGELPFLQMTETTVIVSLQVNSTSDVKGFEMRSGNWTGVDIDIEIHQSGEGRTYGVYMGGNAPDILHLGAVNWNAQVIAPDDAFGIYLSYELPELHSMNLTGPVRIEMLSTGTGAGNGFYAYNANFIQDSDTADLIIEATRSAQDGHGILMDSCIIDMGIHSAVIWGTGPNALALTSTRLHTSKNLSLFCHATAHNSVTPVCLDLALISAEPPEPGLISWKIVGTSSVPGAEMNLDEIRITSNTGSFLLRAENEITVRCSSMALLLEKVVIDTPLHVTRNVLIAALTLSTRDIVQESFAEGTRVAIVAKHVQVEGELSGFWDEISLNVSRNANLTIPLIKAERIKLALPAADLPVTIDQWIGTHISYQAELSENQSSLLQVSSCNSMMNLSFDVTAPWTGALIYPVIGAQNCSIYLAGIDETYEGMNYTTSENKTVVTSYQYPFQDQRALSFHHNSPPILQDDYFSVGCHQDIPCGKCFDVLFNDTDTDFYDVLGVSIPEAEGWYILDKLVCYETRTNIIETESLIYTASDGYEESQARVYVNINLQPSSTASRTSTSSLSHSSSASFSPSYTSAALLLPTTSPTYTASASLSSSLSASPTLSRSSSSSTSISPSSSTTNSLSSSVIPSSSVFPSSSKSPSLSESPSASVFPSSSESPSSSVFPSSSKSPSLSESPSASVFPSSSESPRRSSSTSPTLSSSPSADVYEMLGPAELPPMISSQRSAGVRPSSFPRATAMPQISSGIQSPWDVAPTVVSEDGGTSYTMSNGDNDVVVQVTVPSSQDFPEGSIQIEYVDPSLIPSPAGDQSIVSEVVEITLRDLAGNLLTSFQDSVEICMAVPRGTAKKEACLGYLADDQEWKCEDRCLQERESSSSASKALCGNTPHFTNFAILLGHGAGDDCTDRGIDEVITYLSVGLLCGAGVIIVISLILIEIRYRYLHAERQAEFTVHERTLARSQHR